MNSRLVLVVRSFPRLKRTCQRHFSISTVPVKENVQILPIYVQLSEALAAESTLSKALVSSITVFNNFLTVDEEESIMDEIEPYVKRMKYEFDHWDDAIHGYRETERLKWNEANSKILNRVRTIAFPPQVAQLKHVHILDLDEKGYIKPHIDAVRFCGDTIAGLSLLTDSVMRLVHDKRKELYADIFLKRLSLYIMRGDARYEYTHEILSKDSSYFKGKKVAKRRRISIICRNEPNQKDVQL